MLNDLKKDKLQIILNDEILMSAIRGVFEEAIERLKPQVNEMDNNTIIGEKYRAYDLGKKIIEQGFVDLDAYMNNKKENKNFAKER